LDRETPTERLRRLASLRLLAVTLVLPLSWIYAQALKGYLSHCKCGKYLRFNLHEGEKCLQQRKRGGKNGQMGEMAW
jgi:hypothetical protein